MPPTAVGARDVGMTAILDRDDRFAYLVLVTLRRYHLFVRGRAIADRRRASVQLVSEEDLWVRRLPPLFELGWLAQRLFMRTDLFLRDCRCGLAAMPLWMLVYTRRELGHRCPDCRRRVRLWQLRLSDRFAYLGHLLCERRRLSVPHAVNCFFMLRVRRAIRV